jgi:molecular chaperone HtpG
MLSLSAVLKSKVDGDGLLNKLDLIKEKAEPVLSRIVETFPEYTPHDTPHSEIVIDRLNDLIQDPIKENLSGYEIYFLMASAFLHDIGMVDFPEMRNGIRDDQLRDHIRENHHLRSKIFIEKYYKDFGIADNHQATIIGEICAGHRKENLYDKEKFDPDRKYESNTINIPLLSAFLRIADELDLTFERTPVILFDLFPPDDFVSRDEWNKHLSVSGVAPSSDDPLQIKCNAICNDSNIHRRLKSLELKINSELDQLPYHLHQHKNFFRYIPRKFSIKIEQKDYLYYDLKFSTHENEIIDLLLGDLLYSSRFDCIRELMKNSVDACKMRKSNLDKELTLSPKIIFEYYPKNAKLIISDNGIGMDDYIISNFFSKLGNSFYKSKEFLEENYGFMPLGELGVGILSCFMIARKIVVETKMDGKDPILIEINNIHDYFDIRIGNRSQTGTSITLFLKDGIQEIDLEEKIKYYARHLEFPIYLKMERSEEVIIHPQPFERISVKNFIEKVRKDNPYELIDYETNQDFSKDISCNYGVKTYEINKDFIEGSFNILFEVDKNEGLIPIKKERLELEPRIRSLFWRMMDYDSEGSICHQGIFIKKISKMPDWLEKDYISLDLNLKRNLIDLNFSRDDIINNDKFHKFLNIMDDILIDIFINYLDEISNNNENFKPIFNNFFDNYVEIHIPGWASKEEIESTFSNSFLEFIKKYYYFECFSKEGVSYLNHEQIIRINTPVRILYDLPNEIIKRKAEHIKKCSGYKDGYIFIELGHVHNIVYHLHRYLFGIDKPMSYKDIRNWPQ